MTFVSSTPRDLRRDELNRQAGVEFTRALPRILAFLRYSIHDVVNDHKVKDEVYRYYKVSCRIARHVSRRHAGRPLHLGLHL